MSTLSIENVHSGYQDQVILKGLNLNLEQGEIVALLGPSGCGKTTLLRAIAGLQAISQGRISINKRLLSGDGCFVPSEEREVGMIFQDYALFPHLTVAENVLFGVKGLSKSERQARLDEMLALVKLAGLGSRYPHELSGGQQQRVSIARALAYEPELLLLDEPFSNIDAKVRHEMMLEIRNILKLRNVSAIFVTHSKDEAFVFADKLALFNRGRIVQYGTAECLYHEPTDKYVAEFLGEANFVTAKILDENEVLTSLGRVSSNKKLSHSNKVTQALLLRPEQILLSADEQGIGVITERRFLGNVCRYRVAVDTDIFEVSSAETAYQIGQSVALKVTPHSLVLLDD
ncbi:ABC transporter ATP-binding protein [Shewanella sp. Isolate11]|uniref:ABC transporter ATP-binding protein n=1 Tax=Shewanella sp. Isolate11 TaxID=2908530 RepID=UPI001EFE20CD|nr:ABC transporter ATP-binding protein [Shewanella sp. Isolate11]MCG9695801.1 ABC transporter ATP-binding protein [Shewanella sp. Isolate11]